MTINPPTSDIPVSSSASNRVSIDARRHQHKLKHMLRMRRLKILFPSLAIFVFTGLLAWPKISKIWENQIVSDLSFDRSIHIQNRLSEPRMNSTDDKGRPYSIEAKSAMQNDTHVADLEAPKSSLEMEDGTVVKVQAQSGLYNDTTKTLDYKDNVQLQSSTGYKLKTSVAHVDLQQRIAFGNQNVEGEGPIGKIWSQGFHAQQKGVIHFTGKSRLIIFQDDKDILTTGEKKEKP